MQTKIRRYMIPMTATSAVFLLSLLLLFMVGTASPLPLDITPTVNTYLPIIEKPLEPTPTNTPIPAPTPIPPDDISNEQTVIDLINQNRNANGLPSLPVASELTQSARRHSHDMGNNHFTGHVGSDGSTYGQRMQEAGYAWADSGEIIGWGFGGDAASVVDWWMNSATHKATILSENFTDMGVGYREDAGSDWGYYWTVNFGKRKSEHAASPEEFYVCTFTSQGELGGSSLRIYSVEPCE